MRVLSWGAVRALFLKYGGTIDGTLLRFAGEYYTDAESDLYEIEMRGRVTEIDMGKPNRAKPHHTLTLSKHLLQAER